MDFLKYGMEHEKDGSALQRMLAKCLLKLERWKADRLESRLNKKQITIPESPENTEALFCAIRELISRQESGETEDEK